MHLTIEKVYPKAREWTGQYGPSAAVKVLFIDGSEGDYLTKPDKAESIIAQLTELVGKEGEFEVEERPDYNGVKQWKIKSWPGKPQAGQGGGGGGGRQYTPRYTDTAEGFRAEQTAMNARTAIMQAIAFCAEKKNELPLQEAGMIFDWLQARSLSDAPKAAEPVQTPKPPQNAAQQATDRQDGASETSSRTIEHHRRWANAEPDLRGNWLQEFIPLQQTFEGRFGAELAEDREFVLFVLRRMFPKKRITSRKALLPEELAEAREKLVRWEAAWIENAKNKWQALQQEQQGQDYQEAEA